MYTTSMYRILPSKHPWVLEIHGPKNGSGHLHREAIHTYMYNVIHANHRIIKNGGGCLHGDGHLLGRIRHVYI